MLNNTTLKPALIMPLKSGAPGREPDRSHFAPDPDALNEALYRALNSPFGVTF